MQENTAVVEKSSDKTTGAFRFLFFTTIGIVLFFIPMTIGDSNLVPLVHFINWIKNQIGGASDYIVLVLSGVLTATFVTSKFKTNTGSFIDRFHEKDNTATGILYGLAILFAILIVTETGPAAMLDPDVGGLAIYLAGHVLVTVAVAGWLVTLLVEFGFLEFLGTLLEPMMRKVFKLPGRSSVDALASFVSAAAVGVFLTNKMYRTGYYTDKEAACITTNFSVCSLGFFALLVSIGGIVEYYPHVILSSLVVVFIMAAIVIRIPPLSRKQDRFFDGRMQSEEERQPSLYDGQILKRAFDAASERAANSDMTLLYRSITGALMFAVKIVTYVLSIAVISLLIAEYTPLFTWLGIPMIPILNLFQLPDAAIIAPATLIGIAEIALPVLVIAGQGVAPISVFFIIVLSTVQIIFFTESANAMLESDIPVTLVELVGIFFIRTAIAIPLVAAIAHLLF